MRPKPATPHPRRRGRTSRPSINRGLSEPVEALVVYAGDHEMSKLSCNARPTQSGAALSPPMQAQTNRLALYMAVPSRVHGRCPWLGPLRNTKSLALGTLNAPVGTITIAFMNVVGAAALLTELPQAARQALNTFQVRAACSERCSQSQRGP